MCGRTALCLGQEQLKCACSYKPNGSNLYVKPQWMEEHNDNRPYIPSYNIAPTEVTPVLVSSSNYNNSSGRLLKPMMWGMIPPWHKGNYLTHNLSTNNCRLENIKMSKLYSPALKNGGRCVIVVEGFYEWQTTNKNSRTKQPYYIYAPQENGIKVDDRETWSENFNEEKGWTGIKLLHIAGLYNIWRDEGKVVYSYTVITMESNSTLEWLHHRIPAILDNQDQIDAWLDIENVNPDMAIQYLKPTTILTWHPVATLVNNSRNKSEDCNKRVEPAKNKPNQKTLTSWFSKVEKRKSNDTDSPNKRPKIN